MICKNCGHEIYYKQGDLIWRHTSSFINKDSIFYCARATLIQNPKTLWEKVSNLLKFKNACGCTSPQPKLDIDK